MSDSRNRIEQLFITSESSGTAIRFTPRARLDPFQNINNYLPYYEQEESQVISEFLESVLMSLAKDEIGTLNQRLTDVENKLADIEQSMKEEHELDAQLKKEIEELEDTNIDPLKLDPKEWAPSIEDLKEYLDDE